MFHIKNFENKTAVVYRCSKDNKSMERNQMRVTNQTRGKHINFHYKMKIEEQQEHLTNGLIPVKNNYIRLVCKNIEQ